MKASLTVQGFGFSADEALADVMRRCQPHFANGWASPTTARVETGANPYSATFVNGYVATTTLAKAVAT